MHTNNTLAWVVFMMVILLIIVANIYVWFFSESFRKLMIKRASSSIWDIGEWKNVILHPHFIWAPRIAYLIALGVIVYMLQDILF